MYYTVTEQAASKMHKNDYSTGNDVSDVLASEFCR